MHASWVNVVADAMELLGGGLAALYCCLGVRRRRPAHASWQELARWYPDLDRELDLVWRRYSR